MNGPILIGASKNTSQKSGDDRWHWEFDEDYEDGDVNRRIGEWVA